MTKPKPKKQIIKFKNGSEIILPNKKSKYEYKAAESFTDEEFMEINKYIMPKQKPKNQKAKPVYMWCIKYEKSFRLESLNEKRRECIRTWLHRFGWSQWAVWSNFKKDNFRCVKVKIEEV